MDRGDMDFEAYFELLGRRAKLPDQLWYQEFLVNNEKNHLELKQFRQYQWRVACNPSEKTEEGEAFSRRFKKWWGMMEYARGQPGRDWMDMCSEFKMRIITLPVDSKWVTPLSRRDGSLHRVLASGIEERVISPNGSFYFISSLERAFAKFQTPVDLRTWIALRRVGYNYASWFRTFFHLNLNQYVPWDDFVWSLFVFIKAYEANFY